MRTLVNRVSALGVATVVVVGLSLAAIVEQAIFPTTHSTHGHVATPAPGPRSSHSHSPRASRSAKRASPATLLSRQVKKAAATRLGPIARREYGVDDVSPAIVHVSRMNHAWAFGTEAIPAPPGSVAAPESSLFLAHADGPRWTVTLAGTTDFSRLTTKAPTSVLHSNERAPLERYRSPAKTTPDTGLMLPWSVGQSWSVLNAAPGVWSFDGGDGRVLAAGDGLLYRLCSSAPDRGLVLLLHPDGLATEYYQMDDITPIPDGDAVKQGDYLGRTSKDQPCGGGQAAGRMVRFALRNASGTIPLDRVNVGGWVLHSDTGGMFADRDGLRVDVGNPLLNFGTVPAPVPPGTPTGTPKTPKTPRAPPSPAADPRTSI